MIAKVLLIHKFKIYTKNKNILSFHYKKHVPLCFIIVPLKTQRSDFKMAQHSKMVSYKKDFTKSLHKRNNDHHCDDSCSCCII